MFKLLVISDYSHINPARPEAEALIGLARLGVEITIMTMPNAAYTPIFTQEGIRVIPFHPQRKFNKHEIQVIRKELIDGKYDFLHLFNGKAIINGLQAARGLQIKVVLYRGYTGNISWWDPAMYFKYLHPRVDAVWCIAKSVEDLINLNTLWGKKKAKTITKGHNPEWYRGIEKAGLDSLGIPGGSFVAGIVANNRRMKGIPYLIKSTWHIPENIPVYLLLIGNGLETAEVKKLVKKSPMAERIIFTGYRSDSLNLVKSLDVFVLSSLFGEAITKSVIEAMSLGVAPIITDIPGNKGLVIDGKCGLVVPAAAPLSMAQAILKMYYQPELKEKFALEAKKHIEENYHIDKTVAELLSFYQSLM